MPNERPARACVTGAQRGRAPGGVFLRGNGHELAERCGGPGRCVFFGYSIKVKVPLTQSLPSGERGIHEDEALAAHASRVLLCRVDGLADLTYDIRELRLAVEAGGPFDFSPGQYAQIEFASGLSAYYSMASTPAEEKPVFQVRRTAGAKTSAYVAQQLKLGDKLRVRGPLGTAYLRGRHAGPVLLVAGGSGLAPIYSILCVLLGRGSGEQVALYFGVRSERDLYHERQLADLAAQHGNFRYHIVLSEQGGASARRRGLVHEAVAQDLADAAAYTAYLAGPPAMVEAVGQLLLGRGVAPQAIHADAFCYQPSGR